jgi:hypothetical protein
MTDAERFRQLQAEVEDAESRLATLRIQMATVRSNLINSVSMETVTLNDARPNAYIFRHNGRVIEWTKPSNNGPVNLTEDGQVIAKNVMLGIPAVMLRIALGATNFK